MISISIQIYDVKYKLTLSLLSGFKIFFTVLNQQVIVGICCVITRHSVSDSGCRGNVLHPLVIGICQFACRLHIVIFLHKNFCIILKKYLWTKGMYVFLTCVDIHLIHIGFYFCNVHTHHSHCITAEQWKDL